VKTISPALKAELDSGTPRICRLLKLTTKGNVTYGWTDHDTTLTVDGTPYEPAPGLSSLRYTATSDASVSTQELGAAVVDVPGEDLAGGVFDEALVEAAWASWSNPAAGRLIVFTGQVGSIAWSQDGFRVELTSYLKQLEKQIGHTYTASCRHELYGQPGPGKVGACKVDPSAFTFTGSVGVVTVSKWKFSIAGPAAGQPTTTFTNGVITFTSGLNNGLSTIVKRHEAGSIELFLPTAFTISPGNTFTVKAGCDKTLETCRTKFNNVANYGGFPHLNTDVTFR